MTSKTFLVVFVTKSLNDRSDERFSTLVTWLVSADHIRRDFLFALWTTESLRKAEKGSGDQLVAFEALETILVIAITADSDCITHGNVGMTNATGRHRSAGGRRLVRRRRGSDRRGSTVVSSIDATAGSRRRTRGRRSSASGAWCSSSGRRSSA